MGRQTFRSSYLDWLALVWERLEELDCPDTGSDGPRQSSGFMLELLRIRRECQLMVRTAHIQHSMGRVEAALQVRVSALLHDLRWLLQVSPSASPALARQCVRIAQDRVSDEVQALAQSAQVEGELPRVAMQ
jgi:hypothetical protein